MYVKCKSCWNNKTDEEVLFEMFAIGDEEEQKQINLSKENENEEEYDDEGILSSSDEESKTDYEANQGQVLK